MPVPKRKRSHSRIAKAHANKRFEVRPFTECSNCKAIINPHQVCAECGLYKGKKILKTKMERSMARGEARKTKAARQKTEQAPTQGQSEE